MEASLDVVRLIDAKRLGRTLTSNDLHELIRAYQRGYVDDAQMSALLMAGVIQGFDASEAAALTDALVASGERVDLSTVPEPTVDKHSTGGVGDATTLVVAPMLAAAGCHVVKLAGRGLGHTGGTIDKLESIPGMRLDLSRAQMLEQAMRIGVAIAEAGPELAPVDKRLYALRDVTGTVSDIALIAASVMSKKVAVGAKHLLVDVKAGNGAFMQDVEHATELAEMCLSIGRASGLKVGALITDMSQPLSTSVGNALEVRESIEVLRNERHGPFRDLCVALCVNALVLTGVSTRAAIDTTNAVLCDGSALEVFREMVAGQGGVSAVVDEPRKHLPDAPVIVEWSPGAGYVSQVHAGRLGQIVSRLGAGRWRSGDPIDPRVGVEVLARVGAAVEAGQPVVRVHAATPEDGDATLAALPGAVKVAVEPGVRPPLIHQSVGLESTGTA